MLPLSAIDAHGQCICAVEAMAAVMMASLCEQLSISTLLCTALQVNYNLLAVNCFMAFTGFYQLSRKISAGSPNSESQDSHPAELAAASGSGPQVPVNLPAEK